MKPIKTTPEEMLSTYWLTCVIVVFLLCILWLSIHMASAAEFYVDAIETVSQQRAVGAPHAHTPYRSGDYSKQDVTYKSHFAVGIALDWLMVEYGQGQLGERQGHNHGTIVGRPSPCCDVRQSIYTSYTYLAAGPRITTSFGDVFMLYGQANTTFTNYERGTNENGPGQVNRGTFKQAYPIGIVGMHYNIGGGWRLRAEYTGLRSIDQNHHTKSSNINAIGIGVGHAY